MSNGIKSGILANLKAQWKEAVRQQYKKEPDKVKNSDIKKNAAEIMSNPVVRGASKPAGITVRSQNYISA